MCSTYILHKLSNLQHVSTQHTFHLQGVFVAVSTKVNVKVNFTLEQATKAQRRSRGIALLFL
jgi:hypothetical protein